MMYHKLFTQMFRRGTASIRLVLVPMLLAVALGAQPVPVVQANATTRYVATTGSNTGNDCTNPASPCQTITYAIGQAVAGDAISVAAGTYTEAGISVNKNLTITGAGAGSTIVQAHANYNSASNRVFYIDEVSATIANVTIRHGKSGSGGASTYWGD